jgi:hypothetical protein
MTYATGNTIQAADFNNLAGLPASGAGSAAAATSKAGCLYGVGFGDRGYGQTSPALTAVSSGQSIGQEWQNLRTVISSLVSWQGLSQAALPTASNFNAGAQVVAHESNRAATTYRVVSVGYNVVLASSYPFYSGVYNTSDAVVAGATRSYTLIRISRSTGAVVYQGNFDVFADVNAASALAAQLNASGSDVIVVLIAHDEPQNNRLSGGLPAAIYRCGGSSTIFGSSSFKVRSAYVLVGIPGCGEGNGYEGYAGTYDSITDAVVDVNVIIENGMFRVENRGGNALSSPLYDSQPAQPDVAPLGSYTAVDIGDLLNVLDANRLKYQAANMSLSSLASSTRGSAWGGGAGSITCEFQVTFSSEDHARYFFNTGGELRIQLAHPSTATARDVSWNTVLSGFNAAFRANGTSKLGGNYGYGANIGYYQLTTTYQTIIDGANTGAGVYTSNDFVVQARAVTITGANGAKGNVILFRVILTDEQTNAFQDVVQSGTVATLQQLRATGAYTIAAPSSAVVTAF